MKYIIKEQECGYLLKNGRFQSFLAAGSCHYIKAMGHELKIVPMTGAVNTCGIPVEVLRIFRACNPCKYPGRMSGYPLCQQSIQGGPDRSRGFILERI